jgi:hypothetical protein
MHVHTTPGAKQSTHVARLPNSTKKKEKEKAITEKKKRERGGAHVLFGKIFT